MARSLSHEVVAAATYRLGMNAQSSNQSGGKISVLNQSHCKLVKGRGQAALMIIVSAIATSHR